jgi:hypothetical protein
MFHVSRRLVFGATTIVLAVAFASVAGVATASKTAIQTAIPATSCSPQPYAYAGLFSNTPAQGIQAVVTTVAIPQVPAGHVAGWIGVGGPNAAPNGKAEWLQTGVNTQAGVGSELYAEIVQPGVAIKYMTLVPAVEPGSSYHLTVAELPGQPNMWHVLVNGKPATDGINLPGSGSFAPMAMSESWNGGTPSCNGFEYRFDNLKITTNGSWKALKSSSVISNLGYKVIDRTPAGFTALSA